MLARAQREPTSPLRTRQSLIERGLGRDGFVIVGVNRTPWSAMLPLHVEGPVDVPLPPEVSEQALGVRVVDGWIAFELHYYLAPEDAVEGWFATEGNRTTCRWCGRERLDGGVPLGEEVYAVFLGRTMVDGVEHFRFRNAKDEHSVPAWQVAGWHTDGTVMTCTAWFNGFDPRGTLDGMTHVDPRGDEGLGTCPIHEV